MLLEATTINTNGSGHGALADILKKCNVDTLICGGIGGGAQQALAQAGIRLYGGVKGEADAAVEALLRGGLAYDPNARCDHHDHAHEHHGERMVGGQHHLHQHKGGAPKNHGGGQGQIGPHRRRRGPAGDGNGNLRARTVVVHPGGSE